MSHDTTHANAEHTLRLRTLSVEAIPAALEKARQYRLLNEPVEAESICLDVLETDPDNQDAAVLLLLARSDQLQGGGNAAFTRAREALARVEGEYAHAYYSGLLCERRAKAILTGRRGHRAGVVAYEWLQRALDYYAAALEKRDPGDEDATLRWNACVRIIERHPDCVPDPTEHIELGLE
ncbi:MAG: hypothetical protein PVJ80_13295 [Gemmatimonadota bacterium]|jgi:hypothetical protein